MNIDIATTLKTILVMLVIAVVIAIVIGVRTIRSGQHLEFYRKRHDLVERGWRFLLIAIGLVAFGLILARFGEPVAYRYFHPLPPSPSHLPSPRHLPLRKPPLPPTPRPLR